GLASVLCTAIDATNPEIAAIFRHQDPAPPGAAATNKALTLELERQIASVGGDPQEALKSGTLAPGELDDLLPQATPATLLMMSLVASSPKIYWSKMLHRKRLMLQLPALKRRRSLHQLRRALPQR
ncbi:MAG: hypothetical protein Q9192_008296, partial [Flavoplaca navasiana]